MLCPPQASTENLTSGTVSGDEGFGAHRSRGRHPHDGISAASVFPLEEGPGGPLQTGTWVLSRQIRPSADFRLAATAWEDTWCSVAAVASLRCRRNTPS